MTTSDSPDDQFVRDPWLDELWRARTAHTLPARAVERSARFADAALSLLFPHFAGDLDGGPGRVRREYADFAESLVELFASFGAARGEVAAAHFLERLAALRADLLEDAAFLVASDPAATSVDEVILAYPGFLATACYRLAHAVRDAGVPLLPRLVTEYAHQRTGIDIHPGAEIGVPFAIDHGTGIVIGETATVGVRVRMYQGVTLGALSVEKGLASAKRHPTIGDDVVLYANATVLGGRTVVGAGSVIGGNVWLTRSVPERTVVAHQPMHTHTSEAPALEFHI
jgi:serine O-acetyltransferase